MGSTFYHDKAMKENKDDFSKERETSVDVKRTPRRNVF